MMITAKGYAAQTAESPLTPWQFERREVGAHDVQIEILYCGVCHTDIHLTRNEWFEGIFPMVPGHEIVGRISALGAHASKFNIGDLGGVGVMVDSCRECPDCKNGQEQFCSVAPVQTYNNLGHDGQPVYGGYSNTIVVHEDFVHRISENLDLAGVELIDIKDIHTAYDRMQKGDVRYRFVIDMKTL